MKPQTQLPKLPKIQGRTLIQEILYYTDKDAAYDAGEEFSQYGFKVNYISDGNCIGLVLETIQ